MIKPKFSKLAQMESGTSTCLSGFIRLHPNPRLYKYDWHVFWRGSPCEGDEFLGMPPLATTAAIDLIRDLEARGEPCIVSNVRVPRKGVAMWNVANRRFANALFAPAYDDDQDLPTDSGHK